MLFHFFVLVLYEVATIIPCFLSLCNNKIHHDDKCKNNQARLFCLYFLYLNWTIKTLSNFWIMNFVVNISFLFLYRSSLGANETRTINVPRNCHPMSITTRIVQPCFIISFNYLTSCSLIGWVLRCSPALQTLVYSYIFNNSSHLFFVYTYLI